MRDDTILAAIDEALGSSTRCACGKELYPSADDDTVWLECPTFAGPSLLPAAVAAFIRSLTHDRRPVASLAPRPTEVDAAVVRPLPAPAVRPAGAVHL
jgi:hypothetical protein